MTTAQEVARELADSFESRKSQREFGEVVLTFWKDDAPEWTYDVVYQVHAGLLPDDWTYQSVSLLADSIAEELDSVYGDLDSLDSHDAADGLVDIYTACLIEWAKSHTDDIDEAAEEFGRADNFVAQIQQGQYLVLSRIYSALVEAIREETETRNEDEDED